MKATVLLTIFFFAMCGSGCATIVSGKYQTIPVTSDPPGIKVRSSSGPYIITPGSFKLRRNEDHTLVAEYPGSEPQQRMLKHKLQGWFWGNVLLGGIIGGVVDLSSGASDDLVPDKVHFDFTSTARAIESRKRSYLESHPDTDASGRKIQDYKLKRDPSGGPAKDENGDLIIIPVYEDEPKSNEDYNERGIACAKKGKYDLAISEFTKAIETNPMDDVAYNNRGSAYKAKDEIERAISDYNKAIEINPRLAEAYSNRAGAYYSKGEYDKTWEDVHQAQSLDYQVNPEALKALREASGRER
ncbi:MAG: tetratricopeptide repeat protein [Planctomycetota bacterium]|jgi:hypothetical protein